MTVPSSEVFQTFSPCQSHCGYLLTKRSMCMPSATCGMHSSECFEHDLWLCSSTFSRVWRGRLSTSQAPRLPHPAQWVTGGGGGGIAPLALLLTNTVTASEEEGLHLTPLPRNAGRYFGGGGTGPPPHNGCQESASSQRDPDLHVPSWHMMENPQSGSSTMALSLILGRAILHFMDISWHCAFLNETLTQKYQRSLVPWFPVLALNL